jgi:8-oxo-dGTP diphosphatase
MAASPVQIGIAVVEHRGRYLVGLRGAGEELAGYAEFPGGKCAPGETSGLCARRECLEETGLEVQAVELLMQRKFTYPHGTFDLHFWLCHPSARSEVADTHRGFRWVPAAELGSLKFPEANAPLLAVLCPPAPGDRSR